jgi:hypothetical protein
MSDEFIIYQSSNQHAKIQVRLSDGTLWLTQAQLAELFQTTPQNIPYLLNPFIKKLNLMRKQLVRIIYKLVIRS